MPRPFDPPLPPTASVVLDESAPTLARSGRVMVVWQGGAITRELPARGRLVVGRAPECEVRVEDASVSRHHAALEIADGRVTIEDLGSANGTKVRGERLARGERRVIASGESIDVGTTHLVVTAPQPARDVPDAQASSAAARTSTNAKVVGTTMRALYDAFEPMAVGEISILLLGETGVGKDVIAAHVHAISTRRNGPFLRLNCAAFPDALLESELFGHERGSFTGAQSAKMGLFEAATGGTVLLDEVGELTVAMQSKLLRALEDREVQRVGALKPRPIDVRFLSATSRSIETLIADGRFRSDLYYRLAGAVVRVPPLRDRREEIVALAELFIALACQRSGRGSPPSLSTSAQTRLGTYDWPGNIRELRNVVERAALTSKGPTIGPESIVFDTLAVSGSVVDHVNRDSVAPSSLRGEATRGEVRDSARGDARDAPRGDARGSPRGDAPLRDDIDALERRRILETLEQCAGNQTRAAKALGISRRTLLSRLDQYGVPRPRK